MTGKLSFHAPVSNWLYQPWTTGINSPGGSNYSGTYPQDFRALGPGMPSELFRLGFPDQAEDPNYPVNYWHQKVTDRAKALVAPIGDSAYQAWQAYLDQQTQGTLADKFLDPALNRHLGIFQDGKTAQAAEVPVDSPDTHVPPQTPPPSGPGGSISAPAPANPYMDALAKMVLAGGGGAPRIQGNYPAPPKLGMNMPAYPSGAVPQRGQAAEPNYSEADAHLTRAEPKPYEPNQSDMLVAVLGGMASGFGDWRPGDTLGAQFARSGTGTMQAYLGQKRYQDSRKERSEDDIRRYYLQRGGISEGRENARVGRADRNEDVRYGNETAVREDSFRRADYEVKTQQLQNELASGNWNRAFAIAQAMRQDDRANAALGMQERQMQMTGLGHLARTQAIANRGPGGRTMADMGPGAMISTMIGNALKKNQPIPGYDISAMQSQALAVMKTDPNLRMLLPGTPAHADWVNKWVGEQISRDLAKNPQKAQQLIQMYAKVPMGSYGSNVPRALSPDDDE